MTSLSTQTYYTSDYIDIEFNVDYAGGQICNNRIYPIFDSSAPGFAGAEGNASIIMHNVTTSNLAVMGIATKDKYVQIRFD